MIFLLSPVRNMNIVLKTCIFALCPFQTFQKCLCDSCLFVNVPRGILNTGDSYYFTNFDNKLYPRIYPESNALLDLYCTKLAILRIYAFLCPVSRFLLMLPVAIGPMPLSCSLLPHFPCLMFLPF